MSITIKDETAGAVLLTIDNNGNICFGDGTPIDLMTLNGYGVVDDNGYIIHGLQSCSPSVVSGSADCGIVQTVTVATLSGRLPTVQVNTTFPAAHYFMDFRDPTDPSQGGTESVSTLPSVVHTYAPSAGSFQVTNNNTGDGYVNDPSGPYYDASLASAPFSYRWM